MKMLFTLLLFVISCLNVAAQDITIKGIIKDEDDKPILGANVVIKGEPRGTVTNAQGEYSIDVSKGDVELIFAFTGYKKFSQKFQAKHGMQYTLDVYLMKNSVPVKKSYGEMDEIKPQ